MEEKSQLVATTYKSAKFPLAADIVFPYTYHATTWFLSRCSFLFSPFFLESSSATDREFCDNGRRGLGLTVLSFFAKHQGCYLASLRAQ
jgi:hypothetical protein